ncbi:MAG: hypothetical protein JEZ00_19380 [Anaerolineaceae bacterium]|nr:hypothetical protein [Anaerolineaceae bacterium]
MTTANITYRKNPAYSESKTPDKPRLFADLDLSGYSIKEAVKSVPIYYKKLSKPVGPVRVVYSTRIAGLLLESGNLTRLEEIIDNTLKHIVRFERLPEYFFGVSDRAYPIYRLQDEITTRYPGGPVFSTPDIAGLRVWLADHFKVVGRIQNRREMSLLFLSTDDLQLYAPFCIMRTPDEAVPDIPIFPVKKEDGWYLLAPVGNTTFSSAFSGGKGIFSLYSQVADNLLKTKQVSELYEVTIRKLEADSWKAVETGLPEAKYELVYERDYDGEIRKVKNPVYCVGSYYIAARVNRLGRYTLYVSSELDDLCQRVDDDLYSYGAIKEKNTVKSVSLKKA